MGKHVTKGHFRTIARATWVMGFYAALAFASSATPAAGDSKDACFGMACCPPGDAIVGIDPDTYDVQCRAVTQPNSEDCFIDHSTVRQNMHACPSGTYMRGVYFATNVLTCCFDRSRGFTKLDREFVANFDHPILPSQNMVVTGVHEANQKLLLSPIDVHPQVAMKAHSKLDTQIGFQNYQNSHSFSDWKKINRNWIARIMELPFSTTEAMTYPPAPRVEVLSTETLKSGVLRSKIRYSALLGTPDNYAYLLYPPQFDAARKYPAFLMLHGHDDSAKNGSAVHSSSSHRAAALYMAERGFISLAPDTRGFGEASDSSSHDDYFYKHHTRTGNLGSYAKEFLRENLRHVSLLSSVAGVDANQIYVAGLSLGGFQALWLSAMDARVAGTIVSGIFLGQRCLNDPDSHHECQTVPSLSASLNPDLVNHNLLLDTWDLAALIAPRPLLIQWGGEDQFYNDEPNRSCRIQASQRSHDIYAKLGAKDRIETHLIPGLPHAFDNANAFEFLAKYSLSRSSH